MVSVCPDELRCFGHVAINNRKGVRLLSSVCERCIVRIEHVCIIYLCMSVKIGTEDGHV